MEPRQPSPEHAPSSPEVPKQSPEFDGGNLEQGFEAGAEGRRNEQVERRLGHQVEAASQAPAQPAPTALPAPVDPNATDDSTVQSPSDDTPIVAADEELIEKEWVDKAKQVISETKDDPYKREQEVKKLQADYIKKRYGRVIGKSEESQDW